MAQTMAIHLSNLRANRRGSRRIDALGLLGILLLATCCVLGLAGRLGLFGSPRASVGPRLAPPGPGYPLGTDELGRSLLARIAEGIGTTVLLSAGAVAVGAAVGILLGCISAYRGGWLDEVISRFADILFGFPLIIVAILVTVAVGAGPIAAATGIVVATIPLLLRTVRAKAIEVSRTDFVTVARISGAGTGWVIRRHLLPNTRAIIIVQLAYALSVGMLIEGALSFLGFGVQLPGSSLGSLIGMGRSYLLLAPGYTLYPAAVLAVAVLSVNLIGDSLQRRGERRIVHSKKRKRAGR